MEIIVEQNYSGYVAKIKDEAGERRTGAGHTFGEAMGHIVMNNQGFFKITKITYEDRRGEHTPGEC